MKKQPFQPDEKGRRKKPNHATERDIPVEEFTHGVGINLRSSK